MFGKLKAGRILDAAWKVLKNDKKLVISQGIGTLLVLTTLRVGSVIYFMSMNQSTTVTEFGPQMTYAPSIISYIALLLTVFFITVIGEFMAAFIMVLALSHFRGAPLSAKEARRKVFSRWAALLKYTVIATIVGTVIQLIIERIPFIGGKVIAWLGSIAWSAATMFSTAVIVDKKEDNPFQAIKTSSKLVRDTLGGNIKVNLGLVTVMLVGLMTAVLTGLVVSTSLAIVGAPILFFNIASLVVPLLMIFAVAIVGGTLTAIVRAALYEFAVSGKAPEHFNKEMLEAAVTKKRAKKVFGW